MNNSLSNDIKKLPNDIKNLPNYTQNLPICFKNLPNYFKNLQKCKNLIKKPTIYIKYLPNDIKKPTK